MAQDPRYHCELRDLAEDQRLPILLVETPQLAITRRLANPYAAKAGQGDTQYSDLTEWAVQAQSDWRGGRGYDHLGNGDEYYDAIGVETRLREQLMLGPQIQKPDPSLPSNTDVSSSIPQAWGQPGMEKCVGAISQANAQGFGDTLKLAQSVDEQWHDLWDEYGDPQIESVEVYLSKINVEDADKITLHIYNTGLPQVSLGSKQLTGADLNTYPGSWVEFTFATPVNLGGETGFTIVLETTDVTGTDVVYWHYAEGNNAYQRYDSVHDRPYQYDTGPTGAGRWVRGGDWDYLFKVHWKNWKAAQSFTPASTLTVNDVLVHTNWLFQPCKLTLCADDAGQPGTVQKTCVLMRSHAPVVGTGSTTTTIELKSGSTTDDLYAEGWVRINGEARQINSITDADTFVLKTALSSAPSEGDRCYANREHVPNFPTWADFWFDSGFAASAGTKYWIVLEGIEEDVSLFNNLSWWYIDWTGSYGGTAMLDDGDGWTELTGKDFLFQINADPLDSDVVAFAVYDDQLWVGAGDTVYYWSEPSRAWITSEEIAGNTVTDLEAWGGKLWAARGTANLRSYDGTWADAGFAANLLCGGGGYLHATKGAAGTEHQIRYTNDGTTWHDLGSCGVGDYTVNGMCWYRDMLLAATDVALYSAAVEKNIYPIVRWQSQEDSDNGRNMTVWGRTNAVYIPLRYGLYRFDGDRMVPIGPEQEMGLPAERGGKISALVGTGNWLYAGIDAGGDGYSSVLCYDGMGAWHEVARVTERGRTVASVIFSVLRSPSRLWFNRGDETRYLELPDRSDNPHQWAKHDEDYVFANSGTLVTCWYGHDLVETLKDFHEVVIRGEDIDGDYYVDVSYQVDRAERAGGDDLWVSLGRFEANRDFVRFPPSQFARKEVASTSDNTTVDLSSGSTADLDVGDFAQIDGRTYQVVEVVDSDTFEISTALETEIEGGEYCYATAPAGREVRLRLELNRGSDHAKTPVVHAVILRYQNNTLDRYTWSITARVEDGMKDLRGGDYPYTADELREELDDWLRRPTRLNFVDPDGRTHEVKVTSAQEGSWGRQQRDADRQRYESRYNVGLIEVE